MRLLGIPALEDKLLQLAVAKILSAIYEQDFFPFSYGYRPGTGAQKAVQELTERHSKLKELMKTLKKKLQGYWNYYGVIGNSKRLSQFYYQVRGLLLKWLNRRSQKKSFTWKSFNRLLQRFKISQPRMKSARSGQNEAQPEMVDLFGH
jgi:hypothetical protein